MSWELLKNLHDGKTAVVMGGGPTLPKAMAKVPPAAVTISVNQHGAMLQGVDFIVFDDAPVIEHVIKFGATKVSRTNLGWAQVPRSVPDGGFSAATAVQLAEWMGCYPIILAGMDCFRGAAHWWRPEYQPGQEIEMSRPLENHLAAWRRLAATLQRPEELRVIDSPLSVLFKEWC